MAWGRGMRAGACRSGVLGGRHPAAAARMAAACGALRRMVADLPGGHHQFALPLCFSTRPIHNAGLRPGSCRPAALRGRDRRVLWLKDKLTPWRIVGLVIGFAGVLGLVWNQGAFRSTAGGSSWAVLACLCATVLYGFSASYTKHRLTGVPPMAVAAGSQLAAMLCLAPLAACCGQRRPQRPTPGSTPWCWPWCARVSRTPCTSA